MPRSRDAQRCEVARAGDGDGAAQAGRARLALPSLEGTPAYDQAKARFDALHRRSVLLNGTVLVLGVASIVLAALQKPRP